MTDVLGSKVSALVVNPEAASDTPKDVAYTKTLTTAEILKVLDTWEQDARRFFGNR